MLARCRKNAAATAASFWVNRKIPTRCASHRGATHDEDHMPTPIKAHITGTIWKIPVAVGEHVDAGDTLVIIESMKMEMPIEADDDGVVIEIKVKEAQPVNEDDVLMLFEED